MAAERQGAGGGRGAAGGGGAGGAEENKENKENERPAGPQAGSLGDSLGLESILCGRCWRGDVAGPAAGRTWRPPRAERGAQAGTAGSAFSRGLPAVSPAGPAGSRCLVAPEGAGLLAAVVPDRAGVSVSVRGLG